MEIPAQPPIQPPVEPPAQAPVQQPPIQQPTPPIQQPTLQQPTPPIQPISQTPPSSAKSQKGLFIALALIILMVILGTFVYLMKKPSPPAVNVPVLPSPTQNNGETQADNNTLLPTGTSEAQLDQDVQNIDTELGTIESDLGNVEQGLNDQSLDLKE